MTPTEAAAALASLQAQYDLIVSGQAPNEIEADGYRMKTTAPNVARLRARMAELERLADGCRPRGQAVGIRF